MGWLLTYETSHASETPAMRVKAMVWNRVWGSGSVGDDGDDGDDGECSLSTLSTTFSRYPTQNSPHFVAFVEGIHTRATTSAIIFIVVLFSTWSNHTGTGVLPVSALANLYWGVKVVSMILLVRGIKSR